MINYLLIFFFINLFIYIFRNKIIEIYNLYDVPDNKRKLHPNKTSIVGGLFFFINLVLYTFAIFLNKQLLDFSLLFVSDLNLLLFFLIIVIFFIFGYLDDKLNLNANLKILILITSVFLLLMYDNNLLISYLNLSFSEKIIFLDSFSFIFTMFCFIAFINAFNLFDGINCQIGLYILFIVILIFTSYSNLLLFSILLFPLITFLILNYKGKIFIGNSGSYLLGFVLSYIIIKIYNNSDSLYSDKILLIMFLPGIDMIRLFFTRIRNKRNPFSPDRYHLHHKLLKKYEYKYTIIIISAFMILPFIASLIFKTYICLIFFMIIYILLNKFLDSAKNF
jgi:UDP-GlcNAc:undecaprenyl-phosphate/decaprenyl-phosphate GlcNAc-1-phosphate transferase